MSYLKNTSGQKLLVYAYNELTGAAVTGDAANITCRVALDAGTSNVTNDTNPTEHDSTNHPGDYYFDLTAGETNSSISAFRASSSTANVKIDPVAIYPVADIATLVTTVDTVVDGIQTDLDNGTDGLGALKALIDTVDTVVDGIQTDLDNGTDGLGAIKADTAATLVDTNELQTDWVDGGRLDNLLDAAASVLVSGTADSGTTTTMVDAARTEADTDYWKGQIIVFTSGTISGQSRLITGFDAGTDTITFAPATTQAVGTNTYEIMPFGRTDLHSVAGTVQTAGDLYTKINDVDIAVGVVSGQVTTVDTVVDGIQADLDNGTDGLGAIKTAVDTVDTVVDGIQTDLDNGTDGLGAIKADTAAILVDTGTTLDNHLTDIKGTGFVKDTHSLTDIQGFVDLIDDGTSGLAKIATDAAAILVDTADMQPKLGTPAVDLSADVAAVKVDTAATLVDTNELQADWTDGGRLDLILDSIAAGTPSSFVTGTADSGSTTTMVDAARTEADADYWKGSLIRFTSGTIANQVRVITGFDAGTDTITFSPAVTQAVGTNTYEILPAADVNRVILCDTTTTNTDMRGTDSAALASVCTEARLAELDAANLPADVDAILLDTADMQPKLGTPAGADMSADIAAVKVDTAATLVDTNELQTDWTDGGRLDVILDARSSQTSVDTVDGIVDDILVDTAEIGAAGAGLTAITGVLPAALIGGRMDSTVSAINNDTNAAIRLALSAAQIIPGTVDTVTNGHTPTTTEFQADDITEATADHYNGRVIIFTSGALIGQATAITDYEAVGGIGQFTVVAVTEAPANNDTFIII